VNGNYVLGWWSGSSDKVPAWQAWRP
jgi:hypothetical protein